MLHVGMINLDMKIKKGSISSILLIALEKAVEGTIFLDEFSYSGKMKIIKGISSPHKRALKMAVNRMKAKRFIEQETNEEGRTLVKLTKLGYEFLNNKKEAVWDGRYRIVVWDIPERKRRIRDLFRRRLKEWGFKNWQKSVWVSKRNVTDRLRQLIDELDMHKWVAVIESDDPSLSFLFR